MLTTEGGIIDSVDLRWNENTGKVIFSRLEMGQPSPSAIGC